MEAKREVVLRKLEQAAVATTTNAILEQSDTFVFCEGELITFDGDVCTRQASPFGDVLEGSVGVAAFLKFLQRFPDDLITVAQDDGELIIKGKRRKAGIKMEANILLPYGDIPEPSKLKKIPEGLQAALIQAAQVCGSDETLPKTTHVHIAEDRVEATDSYRVLRADIDTKMPKDFLVHAASLSKALRFPIKKVGLSKEGWFHLKTDEGMVVSLICMADEYYKEKMMNKLLKVTGETVTLPEDLLDILNRAEVMDTPSLSIGGWDSKVTMSLKKNVLRVTSQKDEGWFTESKKIKYTGPEMAFSIHPAFLKELMARTKEVVISDKQIKVEVDNIHFTAALESSNGKEG
jgi:hypothetical protein